MAERSQARPVELLNDFPGSLVGNWRWDGRWLFVDLREEPLVRADDEIHDYSWHFVLGLKNFGEQKESVTVVVGKEGGDILPVPRRLYQSSSPEKEFVVDDVALAQARGARFSWNVELEPGEAQYWSNTMWRPLALVERVFPQLARRAALEGDVYGESVEGRELVAYYQRDLPQNAMRPVLLVTSGLHPAEGDTVGAEAIFEWLAAEPEILKRFNIVVAPLVNPDGFAHGTNGCNAAGINFFWDFRTDDRAGCPEAAALWDFVNSVPPLAYVDFHSYSVQGPGKRPGAYVQPIRAYWGASTKLLAAELAAELDSIDDTQSQIVAAPSVLASRLTRRFNTVTFAKYHLHQEMGRDGMKSMAVEVLQRIVRSLDRKKVGNSDVLLEPHGAVRKTLHSRAEHLAYRARISFPRKLRRRLLNIRGVFQLTASSKGKRLA